MANIVEWINEVRKSTAESSKSSPPLCSPPSPILSSFSDDSPPSSLNYAHSTSSQSMDRMSDDYCHDSPFADGVCHPPLSFVHQVSVSQKAKMQWKENVQLPSSLKSIKESHKSALAYACQVHNTLQAQLTLAEQHHQRMPCRVTDCEHQMAAGRDRLGKIKVHVECCVNIALEQLSPADSNRDSPPVPWHVPETALLLCPWKAPSYTPSQASRVLGSVSSQYHKMTQRERYVRNTRYSDECDGVRPRVVMC